MKNIFLDLCKELRIQGMNFSCECCIRIFHVLIIKIARSALLVGRQSECAFCGT